LINNDTINYATPVYKKDTYRFKKGWNYVSTPLDGVDTEQTFSSHQEVEFVYVYDRTSQAWAGYSARKEIAKEFAKTKILDLRYIEPNLGFYVYASKSVEVKIYSSLINDACVKAMNQKDYEMIVDSGINKEASYDKVKTVGIASRYISHNRRGVYSDTRVAIIYPKIKKASAEFFQYGPAKPKVMLYYPKEREDSYFFIYDYYVKACYMGAFPSDKVPPFSTLNRVK